jgi:putative ABC transport system substrate-binding protein
MTRRELLLLVATAAAIGRRAGAQEAPKSAHIGFIVTGEAYPRRDFDEAMRRLGWIEGRNLIVERRVTGEDPERRRTAAVELIAANPDVIVAAGMIDALPVHALTRTLPIVVIGGSDLVEEGLAASLARPGGNVTGIVVLRAELDSKRLELLRDLVPAATRISYLAYARLPRSVARAAAVEALARPLGLRVTARPVSEAGELDGAFAASAADRDQGILVEAGAVMVENRPRVLALAAQYRLPAVYERPEFVQEGGLLSYGQVFRENLERAAALVDKILKGAKPADLPASSRPGSSWSSISTPPRRSVLACRHRSSPALTRSLNEALGNMPRGNRGLGRHVPVRYGATAGESVPHRRPVARRADLDQDIRRLSRRIARPRLCGRPEHHD